MVSDRKIMLAGLEIRLFLGSIPPFQDNFYLLSECFYVSDVKKSDVLIKLTLRPCLHYFQPF
jgi:hypothetical protein